MSKRGASETDSDLLSGDAKRARLDEDPNEDRLSPTTPSETPLPVRRQSSTEAATDPVDDVTQQITRNTGTEHSSKNQRSRARSPSLWLSVHDDCQQADPMEVTPDERDRQVLQTHDRTDVYFRQARREYIRFRQNRLPSPTPSDEGSIAHDSDADEFGCVPLMFNLENDDPQVEQVFGAPYSHRLRERMRRRRRPMLPSVKPRYATIPAAKAAETRKMPPSREADQASPPPTVRHRRARTLSNARRVSQRNARPGRELPQHSQVLSSIAIATGSRDPVLSDNRRLTRRSRQPRLYELDHRGNARPVVRIKGSPIYGARR